MEAWKILIIALLGAVAAGSIGGALIGRYLVKKSKSDKPPILTMKERITYSVCVLAGAAFILFGVFYEPKPADAIPQQEMETAGNETPDGGVIIG